ncbi:MAG: hypothetical protein C4554_01300 [Dethiobacter sp.]|jgi:hypothetical protein|nr:MAG: hypothetical protein C4554_01300 [Dethiobacter sp.]
MELYVGHRRDINKGYWMSFENHPRLEQTKRNIYARCLPCLEKFYGQLKENPAGLVLEEPLNCWKIVVVLNSLDECLHLLQAYQDEKFPVERTVRGRIGTNDKKSPHVAVIFQVHDEKERDEMLDDLESMAKEITPVSSIFYERGCQDLYVSLCGPWSEWERFAPIKNPHLVSNVKEKVGKLLRGEY